MAIELKDSPQLMKTIIFLTIGIGFIGTFQVFSFAEEEQIMVLIRFQTTN